MAHFFVWNPFAWPLIGAIMLSLLAVFGERRRLARRRMLRRPDAVGYVPWTGLLLLGTGASLTFGALAIRAAMAG